MPHLVLLGDSIFDNAAYTRGGPAVIDHLRASLPPGWRASLLAVDGSTTDGVPPQLDRLPPDATHLALSAGGNDALQQSSILDQPARTVAEALARLDEVGRRFERRYLRMLEAVLGRGLPLVVCTVYYPSAVDPGLQRLYVTGLLPFNDAILRAATGRGLPVVDLRLVCTSPGDYANEIEPSVAGGAKIARALAGAVTRHDFLEATTRIYG